MTTNSIEINTIKPDVKYSICTLVNNMAEYEGMLASFKNKGFIDRNAEFLHINNIDSNQYDAYKGLNHMLNIARGAYVILCHQDISFYRSEKALIKKYQLAFKFRMTKSSCTKLIISHSKIFTRLANKKIIRDLLFFMAKTKKIR